jgi:hypothetical protein
MGKRGRGGTPTRAPVLTHPSLPLAHAPPPWANGGGEGWGAPARPPVLVCTPVPFARTPLLFSCAPPPVCMHPLPLVHAPLPSACTPLPPGGACMSSHSCAPPPPCSCMHPPPQLWVNGGRGGAHPRVLPSAHAPLSGSRERPSPWLHRRGHEGGALPSPCSHPERGCMQRMGGGRRKEGKGGCRWWHLHPLWPSIPKPFSSTQLQLC